MWRILLRAAVTLLILHALLTFAIAPVIVPGFSKDLFAFAQHGFAFLFLALLNLSVWQMPGSSNPLRYAVHLCNIVFLGFNLLFAIVNPEAATFVATGILLLLAFAAFAMDRTNRRAPVVPAPPQEIQ